MPSFVTSTFSYLGDAAQASVNLNPLGGTQPGDFEFVCFYGAGPLDWSAPPGWTQISFIDGISGNFFMYRRHHDASVGPWVFTPDVPIAYGSAARYVARDVSVGAPVFGLTTGHLSNAPFHSAPEITTVVNGCLIVGLTFLEGFRVTTSTPSPGWTFRTGGLAQGGPVKLSDKQQAVAGLTGIVTVGIDPVADGGSFLMALQPGSYVPPLESTEDPLSAVENVGPGVMPIWTTISGASPLVGWTDVSNASDTGMWVALTDYKDDDVLGDFYLAPGEVHAVAYAGPIIAKHVGQTGTKRIGVCRRLGLEA